ncbi:alpha/beta fold hydrolase [Roseomonas sp. NAR14]|uniref:Alpha/beta fold hydrolase n=1 Tax=Roseomonas acroporae TaxID=2937791 RepID=A0A9X1Y8K3_9PROT|nr:alpha/beta fold hydrolase [Roseomonas acroporae]MCK8785481.1 alpha/beta fold hydrolase [Roseomonas acroporae]
MSGAWTPSPAGRREAGRIADALASAGLSAEALRDAVLARLGREEREMLAGIAAYRRHPYRRALPDPPVVWEEGATRLLDHGGTGPAVLFVPSLVNRAYVLDLAPGHSMLRHLAANGARPLLLDWGSPGAVERRFGLAEHVARLERALDSRALRRTPLVLAGYCMGGLLALAAALRRPDRVRALALLATPWDFGAGRPSPPPALLPRFAPLLQDGVLPVDALQAAFAAADPWGVARKFRAFAALPPESERARLFVALEDWLNDGVPLAAPVARETIGGWYDENRPTRGDWRIGGMAVDPAALRRPAFVALPDRDRIVPPASARALAARLPAAETHVAAAGHVGMVAGSGAEAALWRPLLGWLRRLGRPRRGARADAA